MKKKKKQLSLSKILIVCLIIFIPVCIGVIAVRHRPVKHTNFAQGAIYSQAGGIYSQKDNSPVAYNQQDSDRLAELEQYREALSPSDATIKATLIKRENPLAATGDFVITYNPTTDMFQAQINTISINTAKREVDQWFFDQGMSVEAPCELPVSFTIEDSVANSLTGLDVIFSPLAPGC